MAYCQYRERRTRAMHARDAIGWLAATSFGYLIRNSYWYEWPAVLWGKVVLNLIWFPALDAFLREPAANDFTAEKACAACGLTFEHFPPHVTPCPGCRNEMTLEKAKHR